MNNAKKLAGFTYLILVMLTPTVSAATTE